MRIEPRRMLPGSARGRLISGLLAVVFASLAAPAAGQGGGGDDLDGDGLSAAEEAVLGTRADVFDTDGDGLGDGLEAGRAGDADPRTRTDPLRADTDGDGLADGAEDANRNGRLDVGESDPNDADTDDGGTPDGREAGDGTDPGDPADDFDRADPDGDGLSTRIEQRLGTDPAVADSDGDGLADGVEDRDRDGRVDRDETHPLRADTDGGGTPDGAEVAAGSDPLDPIDDPDADPDGDGLTTAQELIEGTDPRDPDTDRDGIDDGVELAGPTNPLRADTDGDGLRDGEEAGRGTDPTVADTDGGGTLDGREVADGTDPLDGSDDFARDEDGDGLDARTELRLGTDPRDADTDDDGVPDGDERNPGVDSDNDGLVNARDPDSDDDGLPDGLEMGYTAPDDDTAVAVGWFVADADPSTLTDPLRADTDAGGVRDGAEDLNRNGRVDPGESDPNDRSDDGDPPTDSDGDGLEDAVERMMGLDPGDADSDDDGLLDGEEPTPTADTDGDGLIDALDADADGDGLPDGLEAGVTARHPDSDPAVFVADGDPSSTTDPRDADSDGGGVPDGAEDVDRDGVRDPGETDPRDANDDRPRPMVDAEVDAAPEEMDMSPPDVTPPAADGSPPADGPAGPAFDEVYGGCDAADGGPGPGLFGLLLLLGLAGGRRRGAGALLALAALWGLPSPANAIEADRFAPVIGDGIIELERATVDGHLTLRTGLWIRLAGTTLAAGAADGADATLSGLSTRLDATLAMPLADRVLVGLAVPAVLTQDGMSRAGDGIDAGGLGDVRLLVKATLLRREGLALGFALPMALPTGDPDRWLGADGLRVTPSVLLDVDLARVALVGELGFRVAPEEAVYGAEFGPALRVGVGARYAVPDLPMRALLSIAGEAGLAFEEAVVPFEAHAAVDYAFAECLSVVVGAGVALSGGVGAAPGRVLLGLSHACRGAAPPAEVKVITIEPARGPADRDNDGVLDAVDRCPDAAEDVDDFEDLDGCPDADNDRDGINDVQDACPNEPEDRDGFNDIDGCPDPDNDGDGIPDLADQCPNLPELYDGSRDDDGCPGGGVPRVGGAEVQGGFVFLADKLAFEGDTATLAPASAPLLADLVALLKRRGDLGRIEIGGHTGSDGDEQANLRLSQARAEAVRAKLVEGGVAPERLVAVGYGESMPIESNRTAAGRAANARIEFRVIEPQ